MSVESLDRTLAVAQAVRDVVEDAGAATLVIGALALAVHGYPRATEDLDLAVATSVENLKRIARGLEQRGYAVELRTPDAEDPLGGVIDVRGEGADLVQLINFDNPPGGGFPRLVRDALAAAEPLDPDSGLRVADPYHLVVFKLYSGGPKSALDILELLERNPALDVARLRDLCAGYRMDAALERVLGLRDLL